MNRLILIGGGSSSGKSYITKAVMEKLGPDNIVRLTMDDYYKDQSDMPMEDRYKVNYDHPKAFDWPLMRKQLKDLKDGKTILKPVYDFVTLTRTDKVEERSSSPPRPRGASCAASSAISAIGEGNSTTSCRSTSPRSSRCMARSSSRARFTPTS